jgi:hypothetical protein
LLVDLAVAVEGPSGTKARTISDVLQLDNTGDCEGGDGNKMLDTITFGDSGLDALVGNGIRVGSITEIAGESYALLFSFCPTKLRLMNEMLIPLIVDRESHTSVYN